VGACRRIRSAGRFYGDQRIYDALWQWFSGPVLMLMKNRYVSNSFWQHHNGIDGFPPRANADEIDLRIGQSGWRWKNTSPLPSPDWCPKYSDQSAACHFRRSWIKGSLKASPSQLRIMHVEGDSMAPTLLDGDTVLVDMTRRAPNPPGIFVLDDGMGLAAKRLEHVPNSDPPAVRVIFDNGFYSPYERSAEEIHIIGRIRWFAREI
jgi:hypothetical protein